MLSAAGFEGPLDWVLEMARANRIDLARLSIAELIQSFARAVEAAFMHPREAAPQLGRWGEWVVMAASLTQMRSALLLPGDSPAAKAARNEAEALRRALVLREGMRAGADWLEARPQLGRDLFGRGRSEIAAPHRAADITDLLLACLPLLKVPAELAASWRPPNPPFWPVRQAKAHVEGLLATLPEQSEWRMLLPIIDPEQPDRPRMCREAVSSTFVASLELARLGALTLDQPQPWDMIRVGFKRPCASDSADLLAAGNNRKDES